MTRIEYTKLPSDMQPHAFDAVFAVLAEAQAKTGEKPPLGPVTLTQAELRAADAYVAACMKKDGFVTAGPGMLTLDPKTFSASMKTLGAYMTSQKLDAVTASDARVFFANLPAGSLFYAAIEAALGQNHM